MKFQLLYEEIMKQMVIPALQKKKLKLEELKKELAIQQKYYTNAEQRYKESEQIIRQKFSNVPGIIKKMQKYLQNPKKAYLGLMPTTHGHLKPQNQNDTFIDKSEYAELSNYPDGLSERFCKNLYYCYERKKQIDKLQQRISDLQKEIGIDKTNGVESQNFDLAEHLPQKFNEALQQVRLYICNQLEIERKHKLSQIETALKSPLRYACQGELNYRKNSRRGYGEHAKKLSITDINIPDRYYFISNLTKGWDRYDNILSKFSSDQELEDAMKKISSTKWALENIQEIKNNAIQKYESIKNKLQNEQVEPKANSIFKQLKAQFIDQISEYCTDVLDASNVQIGENGVLNGIITSSNGKWYIKTILAGGYNIQKLHYRVIMRPYHD